MGRISSFILIVCISLLILSCAGPKIDYVAQGDTYYEQGELDQAIAEYTLAIEADSGNTEAYSKRGYVYARQGNYDAAFADNLPAFSTDSILGSKASSRSAAAFCRPGTVCE